jgi:hypothetical protein
MKATKTLKELRAANAERQRRWRKRHRWLAEQRRLAQYGKSEEDKRREREEAHVTNNVIDRGLRYERCDDEGRETSLGADPRGIVQVKEDPKPEVVVTNNGTVTQEVESEEVRKVREWAAKRMAARGIEVDL